MLQDLLAARRTEVDYINGKLVELAESVGTEAPLNKKMTELIHSIEDRQEQEDGYKFALLPDSVLEYLGIQ